MGKPKPRSSLQGVRIGLASAGESSPCKQDKEQEQHVHADPHARSAHASLTALGAAFASHSLWGARLCKPCGIALWHCKAYSQARCCL